MDIATPKTIATHSPWSIRKMDPGDTGSLLGCAELYCRIWQEPPWYETFWIVDQVEMDVRSQMTKRHFAGFIARENNPDEQGERRVIGFTWGYEISFNDLFTISGNSDLVEHLRKDALEAKKPATIFYIDELGVDRDYRGQRLGYALSCELMSYARENMFICALLRTDVGALSARNLYRGIGFRELSYRDAMHENRSYWLAKL